MAKPWTHLEAVFAHLLKFHFTMSEMESIVRLEHAGRTKSGSDFKGLESAVDRLMGMIGYGEKEIAEYVNESIKNERWKLERHWEQRVQEERKERYAVESRLEKLKYIERSLHDLRSTVDTILVQAGKE